MKRTETQKKLLRMVVLAVLTAIVLVLQMFGVVIKFPGGTSISLVLIPIALGAMLLGPLSGAWLGLVFGLVVYIQGGVMAMDLFTYTLFSAHPFITFLICTVKSTLAGFLAGLFYKIIAKKNSIAASFVAAAVTPLVNTGVFILGCFTIMDVIGDMAAANEVSGVYFLFIICAGVNFLLELAANLIFAPALHRIVQVTSRRFSE